MKILIAPDKFKDALDAVEVAAALAAGVRAALPAAQIVSCPLADGGEGSGRLLAQATGAAERTASVCDPLGRARQARWWSVPKGPAAIVEMSEASGLWLIAEAQRDATRTSSFGTGQLIQAAIAAGAREVTLCVGGSATVDGGAGCLQALGWRLVDSEGIVVSEPACGATLPRIARIRPPPDQLGVSITILCDVTNPLLGVHGAAPVFAPQKGASAAQVRELEAGLQQWAAVLSDSTGRDVGALPGGGAAGGLPAGLAAACDARVMRGFDEIARRLALEARLAGCALVLTGEGRLDEQTASGKVVAGVARLCGERGVPTVAFVGQVRAPRGQSVAQLGERMGLREIVVVTPPGTPPDAALAGAAGNLRRAASEAARAWG